MPKTLSRYQYAQVVKDPNGKFVDAPIPPRKALLLSRAISITAGTGDTLFALAFKHYKAMLNRSFDIRPSSFYYAIAYANDIIDIHAPLEEGRILKIPSLSVLKSVVLAAPSNHTGDVIDLSEPQ